MREFKSAAKSKFNPQDILEVPLDDEVLISYRPTEDQIVMLVASEASDIRSDSSRTAAFIDISFSIFEPESRRILARRLMDPEDPFTLMSDDPDAASLVGMITELLEEWAQRPTKPLSDSTTSSENGGKNSTETVSAEVSESSTVPQLMPAT